MNFKNYEYGKLRAILHFQRHEPLDTEFCQRLMFFVFAFFHFLCKFIILNEMCQNDKIVIFLSRLDIGLELAHFLMAQPHKIFIHVNWMCNPLTVQISSTCDHFNLRFYSFFWGDVLQFKILEKKFVGPFKSIGAGVNCMRQVYVSVDGSIRLLMAL